MGGCNGWEEWSCDNFTGTDPPLDFALPHYRTAEDTVTELLEVAAATDPQAHVRVVEMGAIGYLEYDRIFVWQYLVDLAYNETNGSLSLDWHRDLQDERALQYLDPLRRIDLHTFAYSFCGHSDSTR